MCIYCFISDPYPVYLIEAKTQRWNSLKVKAKGARGWRSASKRIPHVITHIHTLSYAHTLTYTHTHTHSTSRRAPWLPWNFNVDQLVYLGCEIALHSRAHRHTHTLSEDQRELEPCTAALLLLPLAKWTTKHSRLSSPVISGPQPNEDGLCL